FQVSNPTADPTSGCAARTFTVGVPNAVTGEVEFIPDADVVLGPSVIGGHPLLPSQCIIHFTVNVLKQPASDSNGGLAGKQTLERAPMQLLTTPTSSQTANAHGSGSTTCNAPSLNVAKTPDGQTINAGDTATFTIVVSNAGPGAATSVTLNDPLPAG